MFLVVLVLHLALLMHLFVDFLFEALHTTNELLIGLVQPYLLEVFFTFSFSNNNKIKLISQKGRITATHGRFSHIRQVAPVCTRSNLCFLGCPQVHTSNGVSIQPFLHSSQQIVFTVYNGPSLSPSKLPLCMWDLDAHLMHGALGPPEPTTKTASIHPLLQGSPL